MHANPDLGIEVRESTSGDLAAIELLYPAAFPDEDLLPLVRDLLLETPAALSLVAMTGSQLAGHVVFTRCALDGSNDNAALLGPLAVAPPRQRQGIGSAIVRSGVRRLEDTGVSHLYVLGDPAYYGRLGFLPESRVTPPYPLPAEWRDAWQSMSRGGAAPPPAGKLPLPRPWLQPALWAP